MKIRYRDDKREGAPTRFSAELYIPPNYFEPLEGVNGSVCAIYIEIMSATKAEAKAGMKLALAKLTADLQQVKL